MVVEVVVAGLLHKAQADTTEGKRQKNRHWIQLYICQNDSMIIKSGGKWYVRSMSGRRLGTHETKERALRQLAAIEASKARREKQ